MKLIWISLLLIVVLTVGCIDIEDVKDYIVLEGDSGFVGDSTVSYYDWDESTKTATIYKNSQKQMEITSISVVQDITYFEEVIDVTSNFAYSYKNIDDFGLNIDKHKGRKDVNTAEYLQHVNISYDVLVNDYYYENTYHSRIETNNLTNESETVWYWDNRTELIGNHTETRYKIELQPFTKEDKKIEADETQRFTIRITKPAEVGDTAYLIKPRFMGQSIKELTWWNSSWTWKQNITINSSQVTGAQTNFPVKLYINITETINDNATDLRVINASETGQYAREIEYHNTTTGFVTAHINITALSNTSDTSFWLYGGNAGASEPDNDSTYGSQAVWGAVGVWHMNQAPYPLAANILKDSTSNAIHAQSYGFDSANDVRDGDYGRAIVADGAGEYFGIASGTALHRQTFTIIARFKLKSTSGTDGVFGGVATSYGAYLGDGKMKFGENCCSEVLSDTTLGTTDYYTYEVVYDGSNTYFYLDGISDGSPALSTTFADVTKNLLAVNDGSLSMDADVSEIRFLSGLHTSDEALTTHRNLANPTATGVSPFYLSFGTIEEQVISETVQVMII